MTSKSFNSFTEILQYIIKFFKLIIIFAAALIVLSGVYTVQSNEVAVVLRFGKITGSTPERQIKKSGIHFALPFFIDEVIKVPVHTVHERDIITHYKSESALYVNIEHSGFLLTGDNNVVLLRANVKYQIKDPVRYVFSSNDMENKIDGIVSARMTRTIANMDIDSVLTSGIMRLSQTLMNDSQADIDNLNLGVQITNVELTGISPPIETLMYFEQVRNAAVAKQTSIQRALELASVQLNNAHAQARETIQYSVSNQNEKLSKAHGEMADFYGLYSQYVINPQIIINGTFRQRVSAVLARTGGAIVVPDGAGAPVIILP